MSVIDFAKAKEERTPHWSGWVRCSACAHEWVGVGPVGFISGLDCPECGLPKGIVKHVWAAPDGALEFRCNCGCDALTFYKHEGLRIVRCIGCGADQTHAVFD